MADGPGLRVIFTRGEVRLYDLRALGLDGAARRVLGALKVDCSVRLRLALGLADATARRPVFVELVRLGDAAIAPLLRGRLMLRPSGRVSVPGVSRPEILLRLATEVPFP